MVALLAVATRRGRVDGLELRTVARRFATPAAVGVSVTAVTGLLLAGDVIASADAALTTTYGRTLLLKVGLVGVAGLLGLRHLRWSRRDGVRPLPRSTAVEAVVLVATLGLAALLSGGQPATTPELSSAGDVTPSLAVDTTAADLTEHTVVQPNRPGPNIAVIDVLDSRRPAPPRPTAVRVEARDGSGRVTVTEGQPLPGTGWSIPLRFVSPGISMLRVVVVRPGLPEAVSVVPWVVGGAAPTPATVVSRAPVGGLLTALAVLLALVLGGCALARRASARRRASAVTRRVAPSEAAVDEPERVGV